MKDPPSALPRSRASRAVVAAVLGVASLSGTACDACSGPPVDAGADAGAHGLSAERAAQVLARVGSRSITLGDYVAALERMDPFERMRYQTEDRRQALLDEMINVELLAREAERRGIDKRPETLELVRQFQRDEVLRRLRRATPAPEQIPAAEVSRYYQEHREDFHEPERRRAAHIALADEALARRVLGEAAGASPERWRELVAKYAGTPADSDPTSARPALEVPGDLGMLSLSETGSDAEAGVPEPVRRAVFAIAEVGQVHPQLVAAAGRFHILRLVSRVESRQRTLEEADAPIRLRLVQELQAQAQAALIARLRQTVPVSIDDATLEQVAPPGTNAPAPFSP